MDKLEKVINGLECCLANQGMGTCLECNYKKEYGGACEVHLLQDIMELLKAQEPVKPVFERQFMSNIELYDCGKCGTSLGAKGIAKYCMKCGQAVKWE